MKKNPSSRPRKGRMSASTWWRYSLSARSRPARKAPSGIDRPAWGVGGTARAEHHEQGRRDEQLRAAGARDRMQDRAQDVAPGDQDQGQRQNRLEQRETASAAATEAGSSANTGTRTRSGTTARSWNRRIAKAARPRWGDLLAAQLDEQLQDEGGRRQREPAADDDRGRHLEAQGPRERGDQREQLPARRRARTCAATRSRSSDSSRPIANSRKATPSPRAREWSATRRPARERLGVDQRAGREVAEDRADPQAPEQRHDHDRREEEDQKVPEDVGLGHRRRHSGWVRQLSPADRPTHDADQPSSWRTGLDLVGA